MSGSAFIGRTDRCGVARPSCLCVAGAALGQVAIRCRRRWLRFRCGAASAWGVTFGLARRLLWFLSRDKDGVAVVVGVVVVAGGILELALVAGVFEATFVTHELKGLHTSTIFAYSHSADLHLPGPGLSMN